METSKGGHLFGGTLLVAGTSIGGGMLALPVLTAPGGFIPAIVIYMICWLFMTSTGLLYMEVFLWGKKEVNIVSMAEMTLGFPGKIFAWLLYLFLFYSLTVAYVSGGGGLVEDLFDSIGETDYPFWIGPLIFVLIFAPFVAIGAKAVDKINTVLMGGLIISFLVFVLLGVSHIEIDLLKRFNLPLALLATPVVFTAFGFQGIVPTLTNYLGRDPARAKKAIIFGSLIPLVVYIMWEGLILGVIPIKGLEQAMAIGQSAVYPLKEIIEFPHLYLVGEFFAFFAIVTSFLGVTLSLLDFLADGLKVEKTAQTRMMLSLLIYGPPLAFAMINPYIFLSALQYAGGLGAALLLGLLPILMVWRGRYKLKYKSAYSLFGGRFVLSLLILFILFELILILKLTL
ncbi:MAG: amino acid transporter [Chlamydiales bacterium]|nr:amino acid transporter [Chlamydiales bacterium]